MKQVSLGDFVKSKTHINVEQVCFMPYNESQAFALGFLPEGEFIYEFNGSPDVTFSNLPIKEVYYEPYRIFIRLRHGVTVTVNSDGNGKLSVSGAD